MALSIHQRVRASCSAHQAERCSLRLRTSVPPPPPSRTGLCCQQLLSKEVTLKSQGRLRAFKPRIPHLGPRGSIRSQELKLRREGWEYTLRAALSQFGPQSGFLLSIPVQALSTSIPALSCPITRPQLPSWPSNHSTLALGPRPCFNSQLSFPEALNLSPEPQVMEPKSLYRPTPWSSILCEQKPQSSAHRTSPTHRL